MILPTVDTAGGRGRATARNSLSVASSRAGGVGTSVHGPGVVEGTNGANGVGRGAPRGDMAVAPAVLALRVPAG